MSNILDDGDPGFFDPGAFDFDRFVEIEVAGIEYEFPDFITRRPDYHLLPDSPAIDAGTPDAAPDTDMDGSARPWGAAVDIGAYEYSEKPAEVFKRGDVNTDGALDIADAVSLLGHLFGGGASPVCADAADGNDDGALDIADAIAMLGRLFGGEPPLPPPFDSCGEDPTADTLDCASFPPCS